jgi:SSS family solute:Na+ symporter
MLRWPDLLVMGLFFLAFVGIGVAVARKNRSAEAYFLAGRRLPGWLVGCSVMATIVSAMTFLALPAVSYADNWRYIPWNLGYLLALLPALWLFMPVFRRTRVASAYEYLERRFGLWARLYAASLFILWLVCRMSIILLAVSLPIQTIVDVDLFWIVVTFGAVATIYTVAGGLEAVIWTDLVQTVAMLLGAVICLPILLGKLPGGFAQVVSVAYADGKLSMGSTDWVLDEKTVWVMIVLSLFTWLHWGCQDQSMVQRYCAPRTAGEARKALWIGVLLTIPVWTYFIFIGTALYVFYQVYPDPQLDRVVQEPEQILPYFILTQVPAGVAGLVICGLVAAAMSTVDSSINAVASTVTTDFYRRLLARDRSERHYLAVGRYTSCLLGAIMIAGALAIHYASTEMLQDLQILVQSVSGGGLLALTLLGMLTVRVDNRAAILAVAAGFSIVCGWLVIDSPYGHEWFPRLSARLPDKFWMHVLVNLFVLALGFALSRLLPRRRGKKLDDLTVWTRGPQTGQSRHGA